MGGCFILQTSSLPTNRLERKIQGENPLHSFGLPVIAIESSAYDEYIRKHKNSTTSIPKTSTWSTTVSSSTIKPKTTSRSTTITTTTMISKTTTRPTTTPSTITKPKSTTRPTTTPSTITKPAVILARRFTPLHLLCNL